jgi:hypothetical protein
LLDTTATRTIEMIMVTTTSENSAPSWIFLMKLMRTFHRMEIGSDRTAYVSNAYHVQGESHLLSTSVNTSKAQLTLSVIS